MDNPFFRRDEVGAIIFNQRRFQNLVRRLGLATALSVVRRWQRQAGIVEQHFVRRPEMSRRPSITEYMMGEPTSSKRARSGQTLATKSYVKRCMSSILEKKTIPVANIIGNGGAPTSAGRVDDVQYYHIIQGTGDGNRTGNAIKVKWVKFRFVATLPSDVIASQFRVIVFTDKQCNGANPAVTDVVETGTGGMNAGYNDDNVNVVGGTRFRILKDRRFVLNGSVGATNAISGLTYKVFDLLINDPPDVHYDTAADAITDIVSGNLCVATFASAATALLQAQIQICFQDS